MRPSRGSYHDCPGPPMASSRMLNQLTNKTPTTKLAKKAIKDWGIRKGEPITTVVTLRRDDAGQFLTRALDAVSNKVNDPASTTMAISRLESKNTSKYPVQGTYLS